MEEDNTLTRSRVVVDDNLSGLSASQNHSDSSLPPLKGNFDKYAEGFLENMASNENPEFTNDPIIRKALRAYLSEAQSLDEFYSLSNGCLEDNIPFVNALCTLNDIHPYEDPFSNFSSRVAIEYAVNFAAVVETLTNYISTDLQAVNEMSIAITTS
ncbi:predicted protein [Chaetoceros tenuissimus]|uniref:Uncharacterized protein n=1 Tax=Chaetoceros tenuissimus TaxID=426638 RepID=A0AAD3GYD4_9STRA|nr:predicted protein [Chaetoceros tenuissimus]